MANTLVLFISSELSPGATSAALRTLERFVSDRMLRFSSREAVYSGLLVLLWKGSGLVVVPWKGSMSESSPLERFDSLPFRFK